MNPQLTYSQRQWLHSSVGRASHRYREVTGSNLVEVLNLFQTSLRNCINCVHCDDHFFAFSFYTVYNQPDISDVSSSRKRSLRLVETAEIQASLQSPLFSRLVEDGDRRCDLIWASPVTLHFFPLCVLKRCMFPPIFRAQA